MARDLIDDEADLPSYLELLAKDAAKAAAAEDAKAAELVQDVELAKADPASAPLETLDWGDGTDADLAVASESTYSADGEATSERFVATLMSAGLTLSAGFDAAPAEDAFQTGAQIGAQTASFSLFTLDGPSWAAPQVTVEASFTTVAGCTCAACSNAPSEQGTGAVEVKTDLGVWDPASSGNPLAGNVFVAGLTGTNKWSEGPPAILSYNFSDGSQSDFNFFSANSATLTGVGGASQANHQNLLAGGGNAGDIRADIRAADILISSVAGLALNELNTFQTGTNDFRFMAFDNLSGLNGIATFPTTDPSADFFESFILYNSNGSSMSVDPELGAASNRAKVAIHEWLHGLGIGHPQDNGNGSGTFTTSALTGVGDDELDNDRYTVMSAERGGIDVNNQTDSFGYSATPMVLDIAALQFLYGSTANHTGNTTYTLTDAGTVALDIDGDDGTVSIGRAFYAIWDTSGIDTITYGGVNAVVINLNEATLSDTVIPFEIQDIINTLNGSTRFGQILPVGTAGEMRNDMIDADFFAGGFFSRVINGGTGAPDRGG